MDSSTSSSRKKQLLELEKRVTGLQERLKRLDIPVKRLTASTTGLYDSSSYDTLSSKLSPPISPQNPSEKIVIGDRSYSKRRTQSSSPMRPLEFTSDSFSGQLQQKLTDYANDSKKFYRSGSTSPSIRMQSSFSVKYFPSPTDTGSEKSAPLSPKYDDLSLCSSNPSSRSRSRTRFVKMDSAPMPFYENKSESSETSSRTLHRDGSESPIRGRYSLRDSKIVKRKSIIMEDDEENETGVKNNNELSSYNISESSGAYKDKSTATTIIESLGIDRRDTSSQSSSGLLKVRENAVDNWGSFTDGDSLTSKSSSPSSSPSLSTAKPITKQTGKLKRWKPISGSSPTPSNRSSPSRSSTSSQEQSQSSTPRPRPVSELILPSSENITIRNKYFSVNGDDEVEKPDLNLPKPGTTKAKVKYSVLSPIESVGSVAEESIKSPTDSIDHGIENPKTVELIREPSVERGRRSSREFLPGTLQFEREVSVRESVADRMEMVEEESSESEQLSQCHEPETLVAQVETVSEIVEVTVIENDVQRELNLDSIVTVPSTSIVQETVSATESILDVTANTVYASTGYQALEPETPSSGVEIQSVIISTEVPDQVDEDVADSSSVLDVSSTHDVTIDDETVVSDLVDISYDSHMPNHTLLNVEEHHTLVNEQEEIEYITEEILIAEENHVTETEPYVTLVNDDIGFIDSDDEMGQDVSEIVDVVDAEAEVTEHLLTVVEETIIMENTAQEETVVEQQNCEYNIKPENLEIVNHQNIAEGVYNPEVPTNSDINYLQNVELISITSSSSRSIDVVSTDSDEKQNESGDVLTRSTKRVDSGFSESADTLDGTDLESPKLATIAETHEDLSELVTFKSPFEYSVSLKDLDAAVAHKFTPVNEVSVIDELRIEETNFGVESSIVTKTEIVEQGKRGSEIVVAEETITILDNFLSEAADEELSLKQVTTIENVFTDNRVESTNEITIIKDIVGEVSSFEDINVVDDDAGVDVNESIVIEEVIEEIYEEEQVAETGKIAIEQVEKFVPSEMVETEEPTVEVAASEREIVSLDNYDEYDHIVVSEEVFYVEEETVAYEDVPQVVSPSVEEEYEEFIVYEEILEFKDEPSFVIEDMISADVLLEDDIKDDQDRTLLILPAEETNEFGSKDSSDKAEVQRGEVLELVEEVVEYIEPETFINDSNEDSGTSVIGFEDEVSIRSISSVETLTHLTKIDKTEHLERIVEEPKDREFEDDESLEDEVLLISKRQTVDEAESVIDGKASVKDRGSLWISNLFTHISSATSSFQIVSTETEEVNTTIHTWPEYLIDTTISTAKYMSILIFSLQVVFLSIELVEVFLRTLVQELHLIANQIESLMAILVPLIIGGGVITVFVGGLTFRTIEKRIFFIEQKASKKI
ncbi:hypothetical protein HK098_005261 [Nowakowskiella sp. JEL0407]|nr:hypothetical protein HK098_005261 [Nowakowskiella sp. JEL0407]